MGLTSNIKSLLLFLSKTDTDIYNRCPRSAKNNQLALGAFVLFIGLFAFISGSYAIANIFMEFNEKTQQIEISTGQQIFSMILGALYAMMIMAIDREIVSAHDKKAAIIRIPLAVVIGLVMALPIEIKLLEGRIEKQLVMNSRQENAEVIQNKDNEIDQLEQRTKTLRENIKEERAEISHWADAMEAEVVGADEKGRTGMSGIGPAYKEAKKNKQLHTQNLQELKQELNNHLKTVNEKKQKIRNNYQNRHIGQRYDLLSKYQALKQIQEEDSSGAAKAMSMGITFLFVLLELIPAVMKLLSDQDEYQLMLEARKHINRQITYAITNQGMDDIENDVNVAYNNPSYIIDIANSYNV